MLTPGIYRNAYGCTEPIHRTLQSSVSDAGVLNETLPPPRPRCQNQGREPAVRYRALLATVRRC